MLSSSLLDITFLVHFSFNLDNSCSKVQPCKDDIFLVKMGIPVFRVHSQILFYCLLLIKDFSDMSK